MTGPDGRKAGTETTGEHGGRRGDRSRLRLAYLSIGRHIHTTRWLSWFASRGHDVHLLTVQPGAIEGVHVHDITPPPGPKPLRYALGLVSVRGILKRLHPDLLHTHFLTGYGYWGLFSGRRPFMLTVWGDDVYVTPHESLLKNRLARRALGKADYVTGDSQDIIEACVSLGADPDRVEVIQWGVDFNRFHSEVPGSPVRERWGIPEGVPVVLSTRSFTQPYYNIDLILETAVQVRSRYPEAHYIFAGLEGADKRFRDQAANLGMTENVHWVGRIPHDELPAYLNASTVFVTVPSVDATAVSLLEAMACGCAVVASALPSAMEWIRDGETGVTVPPRDGEALVTAISGLIADEALRDRLGATAREEVCRKADHDVNMARVEEIYYSLVEGTNPSPAGLSSGSAASDDSLPGSTSVDSPSVGSP